MDDLQQGGRAGRADVGGDLPLTGAEAQRPGAAAALEPGDGLRVVGQLVQSPSSLAHILGVKNAPEPIPELLDLLQVSGDSMPRGFVPTDDSQEQP